MRPPRLLLLDRDGVLLRHTDPYILSAADVFPQPGLDELFRAAALLRCPVAVVTNQSPVARGLIDWDFVHEVNGVIAARAAAQRHRQVRFYVCPHRSEDGCGCRKPRPAMLRRAAREAGVPCAAAWMVGDHDTDMQAARRAGCALAVHVTGGRQPAPSRLADVHVAGLPGLVRLLTGPPGAERHGPERHGGGH